MSVVVLGGYWMLLRMLLSLNGINHKINNLLIAGTLLCVDLFEWLVFPRLVDKRSCSRNCNLKTAEISGKARCSILYILRAGSEVTPRVGKKGWGFVFPPRKRAQEVEGTPRFPRWRCRLLARCAREFNDAFARPPSSPSLSPQLQDSLHINNDYLKSFLKHFLPHSHSHWGWLSQLVGMISELALSLSGIVALGLGIGWKPVTLIPVG